ncbi:MAG TPA: hypothetical protein VNA20_04530 [Frankiaceae bacterium]|nr:hypothetical protein [Frankiaceae bacterium]
MRAARAAVATALLVVPCAGAHAAAVVCPAFADRAGDVYDLWPYAGIPDDQLDVRRGDIAGNKTTLTAQITLTSLANTDPLAPTGRGYSVIADIGTGSLVEGPFVGFVATLDPLGNATFFAGEFRNPESDNAAMLWAVPAKGKVAGASIRVWVPYKAFAPREIEIRSGMRVRRLWGEAGRHVPTDVVMGLTQIVDTGRGEIRYTLGKKACIPVGK